MHNGHTNRRGGDAVVHRGDGLGGPVYRQAPLVIANILAHILRRLLDDGLADLLTPDGLLILSGILD
ncbi:MAG TPA: hypothetical protein EYP41_13275, partial [Anaerolineae bacterium]|nr:hypothetical protein [Anaerolineae bacterium]